MMSSTRQSEFSKSSRLQWGALVGSILKQMMGLMVLCPYAWCSNLVLVRIILWWFFIVGPRFIHMGSAAFLKKSSLNKGPLSIKETRSTRVLYLLIGSSVQPRIKLIIKSLGISDDYVYYWILGDIRGSVPPVTHLLSNPRLCRGFFCQLGRHHPVPIKGELHPHFQGIPYSPSSLPL
jgi:hypothetical protein